MSAYTSVAARRTLGEGPAFRPEQPPKPPRSTIFPNGVKEYVQRCFASENNIPGVTTEEMQARLKIIINDAAERSALETVDWASLPLPQQIIHEEKKLAATKTAQPKIHDHMSDMTLRNNSAATTPTNKNNSKKRKSSEMTQEQSMIDESATPPWRNVNSRNVFEDRITYADQAQAKRIDKKKRKMQNQDSSSLDHSKSGDDLEKRRQRFGANWAADIHSGPGSRDDSPLPSSDGGPVVGTCQDLEKRYFRLTSAPKPETVRPIQVLEKTLDLLKRKWRENGNYNYICDQFKSLRQDLTVQHIRTSFTVNVYEIHARIALEKGDLGEYNQCQTQLRALYKQQLGGHPAEFLAYRILYFIYTCNRTGMSDLLADLTVTDRKQTAVKHALEIRSAFALGNYHRFFRLYLQTPHMGAYLIDRFIARERLAALAVICRSYKPEVELRFMAEELGFESDREAAAFICDYGGETFIERKDDEKETIVFATLKAGNIFESAKAAAYQRVDIKGQI